MSFATPALRGYSAGNQVLDSLTRSDLGEIAADIQLVSLTAHKTTHSVGRAMEYVDFPIDAVLSIVATLKNGDTVEVGTVGSEGFVESDAALDAPNSQRSSFCQVRGTVGRMSIGRFASRMADNGPFARLMRRNVRATLFSAQQFAACNVKHTIVQRCARWLAMTEDRVGGTDFRLTHELLAVMLGVRRAGVSEAADALAKMGAITYHRGDVTVRDPALLRATACECYAACKSAFAASLHE